MLADEQVGMCWPWINWSWKLEESSGEWDCGRASQPEERSNNITWFRTDANHFINGPWIYQVSACVCALLWSPPIPQKWAVFSPWRLSIFTGCAGELLLQHTWTTVIVSHRWGVLCGLVIKIIIQLIGCLFNESPFFVSCLQVTSRKKMKGNEGKEVANLESLCSKYLTKSCFEPCLWDFFFAFLWRNVFCLSDISRCRFGGRTHRGTFQGANSWNHLGLEKTFKSKHPNDLPSLTIKLSPDATSAPLLINPRDGMSVTSMGSPSQCLITSTKKSWYPIWAVGMDLLHRDAVPVTSVLFRSKNLKEVQTVSCLFLCCR